MESVTVFDGDLKLGDSRNATMVFAQDFRMPRCALADRKLTVECSGVQILGDADQKEISSHRVYFDQLLLGRLDSDRGEFSILPPVDAGVHRVRVEVSTFPGFGLCDDFSLRRITFEYA